MSTIYSAAGTFPLKISESIFTRPSGLIEYSAKFLIKKGSTPSGFANGTELSTSSGSVFIYPNPRFIRSNENPFDEMEITAYGQSSINNVIVGTEILEFSKTFTQTVGNESNSLTVYESWRCTTATRYQVILNSQSNFTEPSTALDKTMVRRWMIGVGTPQGLSINWTTGIRNISRSNYGTIDEVAVMKGYIPEIL